MRLHYHPLSTNSRRVRLAAHQLGVALDLVPVDLSRGAQHAPAFAALNPNRKVPVLEHDGFVLWESYAIMQYLADLTPGQTLYPADARARADVNRWLFWCGQSLMPGVALLNWENHIKPEMGLGTADAAAVAHGEQLLREAAERLDAHLATHEWLCASGLSLADLALAAPLADQDVARFPVQDLPHLQRWFAQVQALEAWAQTAP
ncbi:MAG: glutathione S-transferase family protein [Proteobacteria bacterium]|nr:glutathione S-transferase family protein [Pseudomonadota bacterium]